MDKARLKFRVGTHEFEAEGPPEIVQEQLKAFRELIETASSQPIPPPVSPLPTSASPSSSETPRNNIPSTGIDVDEIDQLLTKIMKVEQRVVSLTAGTESTNDAVLLIVYGQKILRKNDTVTGGELIDGLKTTGIRVARVDRLLAKADDAGDIIAIGSRRAKRYRLTNPGIDKARQLAAKLIETVA